MSEPLRVLLVEDNPDDAELLVRALSKAGFTPDWCRVDTEEDYLDRLQPDLDIVLSDYQIPNFGGMRALRLLKESGKEIPFIIISGTIGEDVAVDAMKEGATDYLLKDRLTRLGPAISQALEQGRLRKERRLAIDALRDSEERFREVVQNIDEVFWMTNLDKTFMLFVSIGYEKIWGRSCESLYKTPGSWLDAIHPDDRERILKAALSRQVDGSYSEEYRVVRPDGTIRWVSDHAFPVRNASGVVYRIAGVAKDITSQKQAEGALQERLQIEERLSKLAATAPGIIYSFRLNTDGSMCFPYASPKLVEVLGVRPEDVVDDASSGFALVHPEDLPILQRSIMDSAKTLAAWSLTFRLNHPVKGQIWIEGRSVPELERGGSTIWHGFLLDITERKIAEERVKEQAEMLNLARDAIIVREFHTRRITFWNQGAEQLYGWSSEEALGCNIGELLFGDSKVIDAVSQSLLEHGEWSGEAHQKSKFDEELIVNTRATLVRDANGDPSSVLVINTDITQQKGLEAQFLRAQRMESIGTLASGLAHDLNNIFSPIMMSAAMLNLDLSVSDREEIVATIAMSATRGAEIVRQVLAFGRGLEGVRTQLALSPLIDEIEAIILQTFPKSISLELNVVDDVWPIVADATQIHQILLNLCVNARDAMPNGGRLILSAKNMHADDSFSSMLGEVAEAGPFVVLEVTDSGDGIPPEIIDRIFDPFFTTKELGKGTGLGLSTVLGIAKSHGGFVHVGNNPKRGATFQIYLPASLEATEVIPSSHPQPEHPYGHGETILVVDDEQAIRASVKRVLQNHGYRVKLAYDGADALAIFARNPGQIAVLLTDLMMPHMDGITLIQAVRKLGPKVPIVASTGLGQKANIAELKTHEVKDILRKPYDAAALLQSMDAALHPPSYET